MLNDGTFRKHIQSAILDANKQCTWIFRTFNTREILPMLSLWKSLLQCKPDISRSRISRNWIYRGRMLDPIFWRPRARYFSRNRGNSLDPIRGRQFFAKSAHRDSLCSRFAGDNFSRNQLKPTCQCGLEHMLFDGQPRQAKHWHLHCVVEWGPVNPLSM